MSPVNGNFLRAIDTNFVMNKICLAFVSFAIYGSLWPFNITSPDPALFAKFHLTFSDVYGRRDFLANTLLFLPIALFGVLGAPSRSQLWRRGCLIAFGGLAFALILQLGQFFIPSRKPDLLDVIANAVGLAFGGMLSWLAWHVASRPLWQDIRLPPLPTLLFGLWFCYRLAPFMPSLHWTKIEASMPSLSLYEVNPFVLAHDTIGWLIIAKVLDRGLFSFAASTSELGRISLFARSSFLLPLAMMISFLLEMSILRNAVSLSEILAAVTALTIWQRLLRNHHWPHGEKILLLLIIGLLLFICVYPLSLSNGAVSVYDPITLMKINLTESSQHNVSIMIGLFDLAFLLAAFIYSVTINAENRSKFSSYS